jgi:dTDP-4-amino-4,6-dideoxygalactose transaminase
MIPRHPLPFELSEFVALAFSGKAAPGTDEVEAAYCDYLGARRVLLVPSARAAIYLLLRTSCPPGAPVVCPAYTCEVVHRAVELADAVPRYIDIGMSSFQMNAGDVGAAAATAGAVILSELYGIPYDLEELGRHFPRDPRLRIFDLAMSLPSRQRVEQLGPGEVAIYSFGWGKPMYAGWGAIACFHDLELAGKTRLVRDDWMGGGMSAIRHRHQLSVGLRVVLNERVPHGLLHGPLMYGILQTLVSARGRPKLFRGPEDDISGSSRRIAYRGIDERRRFSAIPAEWTRATTPLDRKLAAHNLSRLTAQAEIRRSQAESYWRQLVEPGTVNGPSKEALPQSHFPLRIPAEKREQLRHYLRGRGIDTSTLFALPALIDGRTYPNAARAAREVLSLPLGPTITLEEVRMIAESVKEGLGQRGPM